MDLDSNIKYKCVSNSVLIEHIQSIQKIIREEFPDNQTREMCFDTIRSIEKAVIMAAEKAENIEAIESFRKATEKWWNWVEVYDNEYVRPFRNPSTDPIHCSPKEVHNRCLNNLEEAKAVIRVFRLSPELVPQANIIARDILFTKFKEMLSSLNGIISMEQVQYIEKILHDDIFMNPHQSTDQTQFTQILRNWWEKATIKWRK